METRGGLGTVTMFCPKCGQETFIVKIGKVRKGFNTEFGQNEYWLSGYGKCLDCNHEQYFTNSSL